MAYVAGASKQRYCSADSFVNLWVDYFFHGLPVARVYEYAV